MLGVLKSFLDSSQSPFRHMLTMTHLKTWRTNQGSPHACTSPVTCHILVALSFLLHLNSGKIANLHLGNSCDVSQKSSQGSKLAFNRVSLVSLYQIITVFLVQCTEKPCFNILCGFGWKDKSCHEAKVLLVLFSHFLLYVWSVFLHSWHGNVDIGVASFLIHGFKITHFPLSSALAESRGYFHYHSEYLKFPSLVPCHMGMLNPNYFLVLLLSLFNSTGQWMYFVL